MKNTKKMIEDRNALVAEMTAIVDAAKAENRGLTDDEKCKFDALQNSVETVDREIKLAEDQNRYGVEKVAEPTAPVSVEDKERKMFENYLRGVKNEDTPTMPTDASVMIPTTVWDRIIDQVIQICPILERADKYFVGGTLVLPVYDAQNSSISMGYATEGTTAESGKIKLSQITLTGYLGRCLAKISNSLINNTQFDIVGFVEAKMAQAIALFVEGELLHGTNGKIDGLKGVAADMTVYTDDATAITGDELMDTQDAVIDNYQAASIWIMNRKTRDAIRKLKDKDGNYMLNRDMTARWGYSLLGKDVYCSDAMDKLGTADKTVIFYGDFTGLAVKISEEANMKVLDQLYAEQHMTGVIAFLEMDAKVADTQKISKLVTGGGISH